VKQEHDNWQSAAKAWLDWLIFPRDFDVQSNRGAVASLRRHRDVLFHEFRDHTIGNWDNPAKSPMYLFRPMARIAFPMAAKASGRNQDDFAKAMVELAVHKQHDYGTQNIIQGGWVGIVVNVSNKVERLDNLLVTAMRKPRTDSVADAWADSLGYSLVACLVSADHFTLPLA